MVRPRKRIATTTLQRRRSARVRAANDEGRTHAASVGLVSIVAAALSKQVVADDTEPNHLLPSSGRVTASSARRAHPSADSSSSLRDSNRTGSEPIVSADGHQFKGPVEETESLLPKIPDTKQSAVKDSSVRDGNSRHQQGTDRQVGEQAIWEGNNVSTSGLRPARPPQNETGLRAYSSLRRRSLASRTANNAIAVTQSNGAALTPAGASGTGSGARNSTNERREGTGLLNQSSQKKLTPKRGQLSTKRVRGVSVAGMSTPEKQSCHSRITGGQDSHEVTVAQSNDSLDVERADMVVTNTRSALVIEHNELQNSRPTRRCAARVRGAFVTRSSVENSSYSSTEDSGSESEQGEEEEPTTLVGKRKYRYINRVKGEQQVSALAKRRRLGVESVEADKYSTWKCCKKLRCFKVVDEAYFKAQRVLLLKASQLSRKQALINMLQEDGHFHFNRNRVCTLFLLRGFGFSKDIQRSVKATPKAPATPLSHRTPKMNFKADGRDSIVAFLTTLATKTSDAMPDSAERHLPFHMKKHVYDVFREEWERYYNFDGRHAPPTFSYFVATWNKYVKDVKVRAVKRFTKCTECELTRAALVRAAKDKKETAEVLDLKKKHLDFVQRERASYVARTRTAISNPSEACSIVVDGADQTDFGLPHFTVVTKDTRGEALKVKLVGLLEHGSSKQLYLYTVTGQFETGANHVIECIHRWINKRASIAGLPPTLFVQLDNCTRENKNRFMFGYLECLVAWGVFEEVQASFLPVGHTHTDIDQSFSCTSRRLKVNDAITMTDLHRQLRLSYSPTPVVTALKQVANISGLLQTSVCIRSVPHFTQYRYFKFSRRKGRPKKGAGRYLTSCVVKEDCDGEWGQIGGEPTCGFIKFAPDLAKVPKTVLKSPENATEVTERIDSEEGRINDEGKVSELRRLRDEVYWFQEAPFHWNLEECAEWKASKGRNVRTVGNTDEQDTSTYIPLTRVTYDVNSFVVVRPSPRTRECPFWLGQVNEQHRNDQGDVTAVTVRWYEIKAGENAFDGAYKPSFRDDGTRRTVAWTDKISTDTVMFTVPSLTCVGKLGRTTVRRIKLTLNSHGGT